MVWKKFALGAGVFLLLVWLFVPRHIASDRGWGADSPFEMGACSMFEWMEWVADGRRLV